MGSVFSSTAAAVRGAVSLFLDDDREAAFMKIDALVWKANADRSGQVAREVVSTLASALPRVGPDGTAAGLFEALATRLPHFLARFVLCDARTAPLLCEAVEALLSTFVARCPFRAASTTKVLFERLVGLQHQRQVLKKCLDKLLEHHPERARDVFPVMLQGCGRSREAFHTTRLLFVHYYLERYPSAATDVLIEFIQTVQPDMFGRFTVRLVVGLAVQMLGCLFRLNPPRAEDIFQALCLAYELPHGDISVVCQLGAAAQVCPESSLAIVEMLRDACLDLDINYNIAAVSQIPDVIKALPNSRALFANLLFEMCHELNVFVSAHALRQLPRAAKFCPERAVEFVDTFYGAYVSGNKRKRKCMTGGLPYAFQTRVLSEERAEVLVDSLLSDCGDDETELREAATEQLTRCMEVYPVRKVPFFAALLRNCRDRLSTVRRVAAEQLSAATKAFPQGAHYCVETAVRLCGDRSRKVRKLAECQLESVLKYSPESALDLLQTFMEVEERA